MAVPNMVLFSTRGVKARGNLFKPWSMVFQVLAEK